MKNEEILEIDTQEHTNNVNYLNIPELFDRSESFEYYNVNKLNGGGPSYLMGNALCGTNNTYEYMDKDDISLHLLTTKFVKILSRIQRVQFVYMV